MIVNLMTFLLKNVDLVKLETKMATEFSIISLERITCLLLYCIWLQFRINDMYANNLYSHVKIRHNFFPADSIE